jgi:dUTPase
MILEIKKLDEKAVLPIVSINGNSFDLTCMNIGTAIGRDGRLILEYKTGLEIIIPTGYIGMVFLADGSYMNSLVLTNAVATFLSDSTPEITIKFKTNTDSVPAIYEPGEVFAKMIIVELPSVEINELPMDVKEVTPVDEVETTNDTQDVKVVNE